MSEELQEIVSNSPEWYTNLLLEDAKEFIRSNMASASRSFIAIGYYLKYIKANKLYEQDGYSGIWDFAQNEFNISRTWAGRWMAINDRFSKGGNSPILLDQYTGFSASKLAEMLSLPDDQLEQVTLVTTRAEIRGMKPVKEENCAHAHIIPEPEEILPAPEEPEQTKPLSLSIMGLPKTVYPPDSSMTTAGCGHKYDCYSCHREGCGIRQEDCWCVEAPCGHPFPCDTLLRDMDAIEQVAGDRCQFINLDLVNPEWIRDGDKEPVPCCKHCSNQCEYACKRAKQLHKSASKTQGLSIDDLDLSVRTYNCLKRDGIDTVDELCGMTEDEVIKIRNISAKCLTEIKEKLTAIGRSLKAPAKKSNWEDGVFEDDGDGYGAFRAAAIDQFFKVLHDRGLSPVDMENEEIHFEVWAYAYFAEQREADYITFENEDNGKEFKVAYQRIVNEFEWFKRRHPNKDDIPSPENDTPEIVDNQPETVNDVEENTAEKATFDFPCDTCGHDINGCCDYDNENDWCELGSAWIPKEAETEQVETVEADIIQTVPEDPEQYTYQDAKDEQDKLIEYVDTFRKNNDTVPGRRKAKMRLDAITLLANEMQKPAIAEEPEPVQPELPILKNNDQRKAFIEAYETWPIWIDLEQTGERYYRYDFEDGTSFVIRVSLQHTYQNYNRTEKIGYGHEEYFLLGVKNKWIPGMPTFTESSSNKSAMVDHLKFRQKKGA